ncbi:MAG: Bicarbonate transport ATP-binding protein CmpC [Actinobacteria bacterium]|nr:Bicarbonate transport ATP-binding protein CmpC [Actinomycetota bacterium]
MLKRRDFLKAGVVALAAGAIGTNLLEAATKKTTIKLGYIPIVDHLTLIAHSRSQFNHADLQPVKFSSWPEMSEAMRAGALEAIFALTPISLRLKQGGVPMKAVLLGHRNGSVITVKTGDDIKKLEDLKGRTIAIPTRFSTHYILLKKILSDRGISIDQVKLVEMPPPETVQALSIGRIDAFIFAEPFGTQAEMQKVGKVLILTKDIWKDHICCILSMREDIIKNSPEAVQELVNNLVDTGRFIEKNPKEAAALSTKYLGQKPEVIEYVLTTPKDRVTYDNLMPTMDDFKAKQDYMLKFGITNKEVDLNDYVDMSFARKAYKI